MGVKKNIIWKNAGMGVGVGQDFKNNIKQRNADFD